MLDWLIFDEIERKVPFFFVQIVFKNGNEPEWWPWLWALVFHGNILVECFESQGSLWCKPRMMVMLSSTLIHIYAFFAHDKDWIQLMPSNLKQRSLGIRIYQLPVFKVKCTFLFNLYNRIHFCKLGCSFYWKNLQTIFTDSQKAISPFALHPRAYIKVGMQKYLHGSSLCCIKVNFRLYFTCNFHYFFTACQLW